MSKPGYREMKVAHIREPKEADYVEVMFLESARIFKLPKKNARYKEIVKRLQDAERDGRAVQVRFASPVSDVLDDAKD